MANFKTADFFSSGNKNTWYHNEVLFNTKKKKETVKTVEATDDESKK